MNDIKIQQPALSVSATHTPGPWELIAGDDYFITAESYPTSFPHRFKSDDFGSALAYVGNRPEDFGEANARLIAAAPDMLAALEKLLSWIEGSDGDEQLPPKTLAATRAAIAKATGAA